jgi:lipopolysaccharide export system protein LptA
MSGSRILIRNACVVVMATALSIVAQNVRTPQFTIEGGAFKAPISDGSRMIAMVSGREAKPALLAGQMAITDFRLETYDPAQKPELRVESPSSVFDSKGASSVRSIALHSVDGRFRVTGEGWSWQQASGLLVISNRVQTLLRRSGADTNQPPIEVNAERLEYNLKTGDTRFLRQCKAFQPGQARLSADELTSRLGARLERPEAIVATGNVTMEVLRPGHEGTATGDTALYAIVPEGERIELSGTPEWQFGPTAGSAEQLVLLPAKEAYTARGNARMRLHTGPLNARATQTPPENGKAGTMEITSMEIEAEAGKVTFSGTVSARQAGGFELDAARVTVELAEDRDHGASTDSLRQVTATGDVKARLDVRGTPFTMEGEQMVYSQGEHAMIEVSGHPSWSAPGHSGKATRFVIHPEVPTFQALQGVEVTWSEPDAGPHRGGFRIQLKADRMLVEGLLARFDGDVSVHESEWDLSATEVDLGMTTNALLSEIAARGDVTLTYRAFEKWNAPQPTGALTAFLRQATEAIRPWVIRGDQMRGKLAPDHTGLLSMDAFGGVHIEHVSLEASGERLAYRAEDGRLRLMDEPVFRTADGFQILGQPETALALDPETGRFYVEGPVRKMSLPVQALRSRD